MSANLDHRSTGGSAATLKIAIAGPTHPYKGGVASHTTTLAHELAEAGHDVTLDAIVAVLQRLTDPQEVQRIRSGVTPPDLRAPWAHLVRQRHRPRLDLGPADFPAWVRPTDVLVRQEETERAAEVVRDLRLRPSEDSIADWAALGALDVVISLADAGPRQALIIDASGHRSPFARWARSAGYAPVEVELRGQRSSMTLLDVDTATPDVVTRLHPDGAVASDVDETLTQAGWALRAGGLLCLTVPVGGDGEDVVAGAADLRAIIARADDAGFTLVGDVDGELTARLRRAAAVSAEPDAAHALVRLTFRRR